MKARASAAIACLWLSWASSVSADVPSSAFQNIERPHRLWIQAIGHTGKLESDRITMIAPRFGGAFLLGDSIELEVELPLVTANFERKAEQTAEIRTLPGNPFAGIGYVVAPRIFRFTVGGGIAAPLAKDKRSDLYDDLAFRYALAARSGREAWLYTPDRLPIVVYANLEAKLERGPLLGADMALAFMPRVRGRGDDLVSTTQVGVWAAASLADDAVRLGGRIDAVLLEGGRSQTALVPFVHVETSTGTLFRAEFTANLDKPYGFAFEEGGVWGLSVLAGSRF